MLTVGIACAFGQTTLVPAGSVWKYLDDGSNQGTAWLDPAFDDALWSAGPAQLGYGDGDEATTVSYGTNSQWKHVTTYFRHDFTVADPSAYDWLTLRLLRDDGAAVYLNGTEIVRSNLAPGAGYETFAIATVGGEDEDKFYEYLVGAGALVAGENVMAIEVHQRSRTSSDISLDVELVTGMGGLSIVRKAPCLIFPGDPTQMQIQWQLVASLPCTLSWGDSYPLTSSVVTTEYGDDHQHRHTMTGLVPGRKYYYSVAAGDEAHGGSFFSAPDPSAPDLKFMVYGDTRTNPTDHDAVAAGMISAYQADPACQSLVFHVGDLVSDGDLEEKWDEEFFDAGLLNIGQLLGETAFQACIGNHEGDGILFEKYFPYPYTADRYWSFDYGPAHFSCVDQYVDYGPGSDQLAWLENDLATTSKPWRFIYLHEPGWSAGGGHGNDGGVQQYIQPLCEQYGVAIVFGGHNHYYARAVVNDVQHVTAGGGGAPLYTPDLNYPYVVAGERAFSFCKVEISGHTLNFSALRADGTEIESFTMQSLVGVASQVPDRAAVLDAVFPNPSNPGVVIPFTLSASQAVSLAVYDLKGRLVASLADHEFPAGAHDLPWDGKDLTGRPAPSSTYLAVLKTDSDSLSRKFMLVR